MSSNDDLKLIKKRLGVFLKDSREVVGLSQRDVANELEVSYQSVSSWEMNRTTPKRQVLMKLLELYEPNMNILKGEDTELYNYIYKRVYKLSDDNFINKFFRNNQAHMGGIGNTNTINLEPVKEEVQTISEKQISNQIDLNKNYSLDSWIDIPVFKRLGKDANINDNPDIINSTKIPTNWCFGNRYYFALISDSDSNKPYIDFGDCLIVQRINSVDQLAMGDFVVYQLNGSETEVAKYDNKQGIILKFLNDNYRPKSVTVFDNFKIYGIVREIRRTVK